MTNSQTEFSDAVRLIKGLTRETDGLLAGVLGVTAAAFSSRVRGETDWKLKDVEALATHWRVEVADLLVGPIEAKDAVRRSIPGYEESAGQEPAMVQGSIDAGA